MNVAHQGDIVFATWFTYDAAGKAWWLSMTANLVSGGNTFTGTLYKTSGPPFSATPFDPALVVPVAVGSGTLTFTDASNGTFAFTVNGISRTKPITRQVFGPQPTCRFGVLAHLEAATNYQDLWWNAPGGSESGWGLNVTHQGDTLFVTWFTYDVDGSPLWLSATAQKTAARDVCGDVVPDDRAAVQRHAVESGIRYAHVRRQRDADVRRRQPCDVRLHGQCASAR